jgi:hypothetical protein
MAKIPPPVPGLVFRYGYLRIRQYEQGETTGKERPCCILFPLKQGQVIDGYPLHVEEKHLPTNRHVADDGEVLILLIQSDEPGSDQLGLQMTLEDKRYVGLPDDAPSYIIVSEANIDRWPNGDMYLLPGKSNSFVYLRTIGGPLLSRVSAAFLHAQKSRKVRMLLRHP